MNWEVYPEGTKADRNMKCYICSSSLRSRGEMDHFPIPKRFGGTKVMPICINCHDDKDRHFIKLDSEESFESAMSLWAKADTQERIILARMYSLILDQGALVSTLLESEERLPCGHPVTDDSAHNDPNPGATHFCVSCAKESEE